MDYPPAERPTYANVVAERGSTARLPLAIVAGLVAALIGGALWAGLVAATNFKIGYAAIGVGFLVGFTIRGIAQGHNPAYGYAGAALALLGCMFGDVLSDSVVLAKQMDQPLMSVVTHLTPNLAVELLKAGFSPMDALFYVLAAMAGYRNAFSKDE